MESQEKEKTNRKFIALLFIISIGIVSAIYLALNRPKETVFNLQEPSLPVSKAGMKERITLFFADSDQGILVSEEREIEGYVSTPDQVKECFRQLIYGPRNRDLSPVISPRTKLKGVFLDLDKGIAYIDFSPEIRTDHPGGAEAEMLTTYAIINTLCHNFPVIKKVQILIDGQEKESIAGHVFIQLPLMPDWRLHSKERQAYGK
jgi:germination protein M